MKRRRIGSFVIALAVTVSLLSLSVSAATFGDVGGHWAEAQIEQAIAQNIVSGFPEDNTFRPNAPVTRAQFFAMVNQAYGFEAEAAINFTDVKESDWYYSAVAKAMAAGYAAGMGDGTVGANRNLTRAQAAVIISNVLSLPANEEAANGFTDAWQIPAWAKGAVGALVENGIYGGRSGNTIAATDNITRAETVVVLLKALDLEVGTEQTPQLPQPTPEITTDDLVISETAYGPESGVETINANVQIVTPGTTLKNVIIKGNLTIASTVGEGEVTLENVTVEGETIVNGGGINSITIKDSRLGVVTIAKASGSVRLIATGTSEIDEAIVQSSARLEESSLTEKGFTLVNIAEDIRTNARVYLNGTFDEVNVNAKTTLYVDSGRIEMLNVLAGAKDSVITLADGVRVGEADVLAAIRIDGKGVIALMSISVEGVRMVTLPTKYAEGSKEAERVSSSSGGGGGGGGGGTPTTPTTPPPPAPTEQEKEAINDVVNIISGGNVSPADPVAVEKLVSNLTTALTSSSNTSVTVKPELGVVYADVLSQSSSAVTNVPEEYQQQYLAVAVEAANQAVSAVENIVRSAQGTGSAVTMADLQSASVKASVASAVVNNEFLTPDMRTEILSSGRSMADAQLTDTLVNDINNLISSGGNIDTAAILALMYK